MGMSRPPALVEAWTALSCTQTVVFVVLTIFHHYCYYFSFDSEVCVLKLKTRGGEGRENNPVQ